MRHLSITIILALLTVSPIFAGETSDMLKQLDEEISKSEQHHLAKEGRIQFLKDRLKATGNEDERSALEWKLFDEYRNFQADTAMLHAKTLYQIAEESGDVNYQTQALVALMDCFVSTGFFKEASDINQRLEEENIPAEIKPFYYEAAYMLYKNLAFQAQDSKSGIQDTYEKRSKEYLEKLIASTGPMSYEHGDALIELDRIKGLDPSEEIDRRNGFLSTYKLTDSQRAIQYMKLGNAAINMDDIEKAQQYFALAAIYDLRAGNRDASALKCLAQLLSETENHKEATRYIHLAFNRAEGLNSPLQLAEIGFLMPVIDHGYKNRRRVPVGGLIAAILGGAVFVGLSVYQFIKLRGLNDKLANAKKTLKENQVMMSQRNVELINSRHEIEDVLAKLKESNQIKDKYIRQSLGVNTGFLSTLEEKVKGMVKLIKEKKFDELKLNPYQLGIKQERVRIYKSFDETFLKLFPDFIEQFNTMMPENDPVFLEPDGTLPTDLRIFALTRLGISDPAEIAQYLNLSVKTVYVYKTKLKTRSLVDNNEFEDRLMEIHVASAENEAEF